jgi:hypothetical protein
MRKAPADDFDPPLPSLRANDRDAEEFEPPMPGQGRDALYSRTSPVVTVKAPMVGGLWALSGALAIALVGLGWWSFQQISLMEQQLVATQESFARTSEDAAGRLQAISGKVANSESSVTSGNEALKVQVQQLQEQLEEQARQQQQGVAGVQSDLGKRLQDALTQSQAQLNAQLTAQATAQQVAVEQAQAELKAMAAEVTGLKTLQASQARLDAQLNALNTDVAALKKQGNPSARLEQIDQDLLVLKSQLDNRPAPTSTASTAEFDAFRAQVTRNVTALQSQVQNLQQQLNSRPRQ